MIITCIEINFPCDHVSDASYSSILSVMSAGGGAVGGWEEEMTQCTCPVTEAPLRLQWSQAPPTAVAAVM